jgi:hypothetical protein
MAMSHRIAMLVCRGSRVLDRIGLLRRVQQTEPTMEARASDYIGLKRQP